MLVQAMIQRHGRVDKDLNQNITSGSIDMM